MSWPRVDVNEYIRRYDELNDSRHNDEINELTREKNNFDHFSEYREINECRKQRNELDDLGNCNQCIEFCKKGRDDFDAINAIREALIVIEEALRDIEKNRICKGIFAIMESIKDTEEGVNDLVRILNKVFV